MEPTHEEFLAALPPRDPWTVTIIKLTAPVALFAGLYLLAFLLFHEGARHRDAWLYMTALYMSPFGKFVAIGMINAGFDLLTTTFFLGTIEVCFALFFTVNFDLLYRVPRVGRWVRKAELKGARTLQRRAWIRRSAFLGIVLWVMVPFQGTGALVGALMGRLLGLGKVASVGAISLGGFTGVLGVGATTLGLRSAYAVGLDWGLYSTILLITVLYVLWAGFWNPYRPAPPDGQSV